MRPCLRALLALAVVFAPARAHGQSALLPCDSGDSVAWHPGQADRHACHQTVLGGIGDYASYPFDRAMTNLVAAIHGTSVVAIREFRPGADATVQQRNLDFSAATVVDEGHVGAPGELWWGRVAHGSFICCNLPRVSPTPINVNPLHVRNESESLHLAVGQESSERLITELRTPQAIQAYARGELLPWPVAAGRLQYVQVAATSPVSIGSVAEAPGTVTDAKLAVDLGDRLAGVLTFSLSIGGKAGTITIPMKRAVDEADVHGPSVPGYRFRLWQAKASAGGILADCRESPGSGASDRCWYDESPNGKHYSDAPQYSASGIFYGVRSEYLAVRFRIIPKNPAPGDGSTNWGRYEGLIVLRRVP